MLNARGVYPTLGIVFMINAQASHLQHIRDHHTTLFDVGGCYVCNDLRFASIAQPSIIIIIIALVVHIQ
jgi:hypothetical protein